MRTQGARHYLTLCACIWIIFHVKQSNSSKWSGYVMYKPVVYIIYKYIKIPCHLQV